MPSEFFSSRLLVLPTVALCLALGTGCEDEDPFAHLRDTTSDTDGDNSDDEASTGASSTKDDDDRDDKGETTGKEDNEDSSTGTQDENSGDTDTTDGGDTTGQEAPENKMCDLRPTSLAILGDATPAGYTVDGGDDDANAFKILHEHLKSAHKLSELSYENYAANRAMFVALDQEQMLKVSENDKGPVMVVIHSGSHDLANYVTKLDSVAENDFDGEWKKSLNSLNKLVAHFDDDQKFPNGATIILNTLYNPFDDCQERHNVVVRISEVKTKLMAQFNQNLRDFADKHDHVFVADQHPAFLGHGHHHANEKCPHYKAGSDYLMQGGADLTNLNEAGHAFMGNVLKETVDEIFKGCS